jgi:hypothetical protein
MDLQTVIAAGYPGLIGKQTWNISEGKVNGIVPGSIFKNQGLDFKNLIAHGAAIDHGNSGGPLLIVERRRSDGDVDPSDARNFRVAGVNVLSYHETRYFAIPVEYVRKVLERARASQQMMGAAESRKGALEMQAKLFEAELGKVSANQEDEQSKVANLLEFMSNAYIGKHGLETILTLLKQKADDGGMKELKASLMDMLKTEPAQAFELGAALHFGVKIKTAGDLSTTRFREINFADVQRISELSEVSTSFLIGGKKQDVTWTMEAGQWRVSDLKFVASAGGSQTADNNSSTSTNSTGETEHGGGDSARLEPLRKQSSDGESTAAPRDFSMEFSIASGALNASGDVFDGTPKRDSSGLGLSLLFDEPLRHEFVGLIFGLGYIHHGVSYDGQLMDGTQVTIEESVSYLQLPLLIRVDATFSLSKTIALRPFARVGTALEIDVSNGGKVSGSSGSASLDSTYYSGHHSVNISLLFGGGLEMDFGGFALGADLMWDNHLLDEWSSSAIPSGQNDKYEARYLGAFGKVDL